MGFSNVAQQKHLMNRAHQIPVSCIGFIPVILMNNRDKMNKIDLFSKYEYHLIPNSLRGCFGIGIFI